ncbi:MAG: methyltransferase family protein [Bacteroidales bacterium]
MKLLDHFSQSGDIFFRLRSYLPLLLLPAFLLALHDPPAVTGAWRAMLEAAAFLLSLFGLAIRIFTIGSAPPGTSERSTRDPRASLLNTRGPYSVVRHPLYLGSTIVALGLAVFTLTWYMPVIVILAGLLYHERICAREEVFLESRFGDEFRMWAGRVPALIPALGRYEPSAGRFRWKKVFGREFHGLFVIGSSFYVLDGIRQFFAIGRWAPDRTWAALFVVTGAIFVGLTLLKKTTRVLAISESPLPPRARNSRYPIAGM